MATAHGEKILKYLEENGTASSLKLAELWNEDHQKIVGTVKSLLCLGDVIEADLQSSAQWGLSEEGRQVAEEGSHEAQIYNAIPPAGSTQAEIVAKAAEVNSKFTKDMAKVGFSKAMSLGWIAVDKSSGAPKFIRKVDSIQDKVQEHLKELATGKDTLTNELRTEYKKRKLIQEIVIKSYLMKPGPSFTTSVTKQETDLTPEMIASGSWKTKEFKPYNLNALGIPIQRGHLHPLMKVRAEFRQIFLEMGFSEMPTNNFVESSFWNFDALFQPQQHPARDAHDTFFLSDPATAKNIPVEYMERVKKVHSQGGYGSQGYGYDWKIEEAQKNLLRTHTTAVSARMLYALAKGGFKPAKYFSIDRVFRNETLDATHLAEFHQIEGVIADYGLTLGNLIGVLYEFFRKLGIEKLRFKPAYNPYTEPSMEIFSYHPGLKKWVEIGNSGIFRPEMLLPMGLPEDVSVLAWGLSLERPTMIKYGYDNIRDLVGPKVNMQMVADNPLCRLDKHHGTEMKETNDLQDLENRMDSIMTRLRGIETEVKKLKKQGKTTQEKLTLVIEADPKHPPLSIQTLVRLLVVREDILVTIHQHSSLATACPTDLMQWSNLTVSNGSRINNQCNLTWIWKAIGRHPIAKVVNQTNGDIQGEAAIARLLTRLLESWTDCAMYENFDSSISSEIDEWLDIWEDCIHSGDSKFSVLIRRIHNQLGHSDGRKWLVGPLPGVKSLADIFLSSLLSDKLSTGQAKEWISRCISV
uniref:phenylalanine--tRNA ligase n=1 Tax=Daphnia galeata TaxID=27404 RepID=A0A8J2RG87_9CRUS|nr:unnamed protein product [Daphnia galeata]